MISYNMHGRVNWVIMPERKPNNLFYTTEQRLCSRSAGGNQAYWVEQDRAQPSRSAGAPLYIYSSGDEALLVPTSLVPRLFSGYEARSPWALVLHINVKVGHESSKVDLNHNVAATLVQLCLMLKTLRAMFIIMEPSERREHRLSRRRQC